MLNIIIIYILRVISYYRKSTFPAFWKNLCINFTRWPSGESFYQEQKNQAAGLQRKNSALEAPLEPLIIVKREVDTSDGFAQVELVEGHQKAKWTLSEWEIIP